jgi:hypothetical protein
MLRRRNGQRGLWEVLQFGDLEPEKQMDPRLRRIDEVLKDDTLVDTVLEAMRGRFPQSGRRGRRGTPAEVALRMPGSQAPEELELRAARVGGERQPRVPALLPNRRGQGARRQDDGPSWTTARRPGVAQRLRARRSDRRGSTRDPWPQDACRYDRRRNADSVPERFASL